MVFFLARQGEISWFVHLFVRDRWPTEFWLCKVEVKTRSFQQQTQTVRAAETGRSISAIEWKHTMMLHIFIVCSRECCMRAGTMRALKSPRACSSQPHIEDEIYYGVLLLLLMPGRVQTKSMYNENVKKRTARIFYNAFIYGVLWRVFASLQPRISPAFQNLNKMMWKPWFKLIKLLIFK